MIEGKVKWFNTEKGFGFIYTNKLDDHFFSVKDIDGFDLPTVGDIVEFKSNNGKKGLFATKINIIKSNKNNNKIECPSCGEMVKPKTIHNPRKEVWVEGEDGDCPEGGVESSIYYTKDYSGWRWQNAYISGNCPLCGYEIWSN